LSFKLTFWIRLDLKLSCSHFQLNSSQITHIFNLMQFDSTENWVNSTQFIKNLSLTSKELNIEIFSTFALSFCIIFLIENHEEKTWRLFDFDRKSWQKNMIESHEEKSCKLFNQVIYIYLISYQIKLNFWVKLLSQASQLNLSCWVQLLNLTQHFLSWILDLNLSTWLNVISLIIYSFQMLE